MTGARPFSLCTSHELPEAVAGPPHHGVQARCVKAFINSELFPLQCSVEGASKNSRVLGSVAAASVSAESNNSASGLRIKKNFKK